MYAILFILPAIVSFIYQFRVYIDGIFQFINFVLRERSLFGVTLCDEMDELVGHAAFSHIPNHQDKFSKEMDPAEWDVYVKASFECTPQPESARSSVMGVRSSRPHPPAKKPTIEMDKLTPLNAMFLHLFVARDDVKTSTALRESLRTLFANVFDTHFILLIVPTEVTLRMLIE